MGIVALALVMLVGDCPNGQGRGDKLLARYELTEFAGCEAAQGCQELMTRKVAALHDLRLALEAEDPTVYRYPIARLRRSERMADHYGENLGSAEASYSVSWPARQAIRWIMVHR